MNSWWFGVADNLQNPQNAPKKHVCSSWNIHQASKWTLGPPTDELCQRRALQNAGLASCKKSRKRLGRFVALHLEFHETSTIHTWWLMIMVYLPAPSSRGAKRKTKKWWIDTLQLNHLAPKLEGPGIHKCSFGRWNFLFTGGVPLRVIYDMQYNLAKL